MAVIAENMSAGSRFEKDKKYRVRSYGKRRNQAFCDGSHQRFSDDRIAYQPPRGQGQSQRRGLPPSRADLP